MSVRQIQCLSVESHAIVLKGDIQNYLHFQLQFLSGEEAAQVPSHSSVADTGFHTLLRLDSSPKLQCPAELITPSAGNGLRASALQSPAAIYPNAE